MDMTIEEFTERLVEELRFQAPSYVEEILPRDMIKNNDVKMPSINFKLFDEQLGPVIYISDMYQACQEGMPISEAAEKILDHLEQIKGEHFGFNQDINEIYNPEKLYVRAVNQNQHTKGVRLPIEGTDICMEMRVVVNETADGIASVMVDDAMLERMGLDRKEAFEKAVENTKVLFPPFMDTMPNVFMKMGMGPMLVGDTPDGITDQIIVVSNDKNVNGAIVAFLPEVMQDISDKYFGGENFLVLPSSIHESLCVSEHMGMDLSEMEEMIGDINKAVVQPQEVLSDRLFKYDAKEHKISFAVPQMQRERKLAACLA